MKLALVAGALAALLVTGTARAEGECVPACREGFVCHQGQCISACNPPCGPGEVCQEGRRCVPTQPGTTSPPPVDSAGGVPIVDHSQAGGSQVVVVEDPATGYGAAQPTYAQPQPYAQPSPQPAQEPEYEDPQFSVGANMLGFLQFGPVVFLEMGGSFAGHVRLRFPNAGLYNFYDLDVDFDDTEELDFGIAIGGGARYYLSSRGTMRGFYLGAAFEIEHNEWYIEDCEGFGTPCGGDQYDDSITRLVIVGQLGWRWGFSSFFFGVGGELGYASVIGHSRSYYEDSPDIVSTDPDGIVFGMVSLEIGFYL